jgi:hypothetical protein
MQERSLKKSSYYLIFLILMLFFQNVSAMRIERLVMPGDLIQGHSKLEDECEKCHQSFTKGAQTKLCRNCHEDIDLDIKKKSGFHGASVIGNRACTDCHTDHEGRNAMIVLFEAEAFDHVQTDFELKGKHKQLACNSCHKPKKKYREAAHDCYDCHKDEEPHEELLGKECSDCHNEEHWHKTEFDHSKTDFPLKNKHKDVSCESCHPANVSKEISKKCITCHRINDIHGGRYGKKCENCHSTRGWGKIAFNHNKTDFPLRGSHKRVSCDNCHSGDINEDLKTDCYSCHQYDDEHRGQYGRKCQDCHNSTKWGKAKFNHDKTDFPLKGKHEDVKCNSCHKTDLYNDELDTNCNGCHAQDDVHNNSEGEKCEDCHNEQGWNKHIVFDHDMTVFPLVGLHAVAPCEECHLTQAFKDAEIICNKCHEKDDIHKQKLGSDCNFCHNPNSWEIWEFDHNKQTDYVLDGEHEGLDCHACHTEAQEEISLKSACVNCHMKDDIHDGDFTYYCERCHVTSSFKDITLIR